MKKTLEAWIRGYVKFYVNGKMYYLYSTAKKAREAVPDNEGVLFCGFHIFKGWRSFYTRVVFKN